MRVRAILEEKGERVVTARPETPMATALALLRLERIGALVVSEDGEKVLGLLSEREIVYGLAEHGMALLDKHVGDLMIKQVATCRPDDGVSGIMAVMTQKRIRHLPVVEHGRIVGIVSIGDIVKHRLGELQLEANVLRDMSVARH